MTLPADRTNRLRLYTAMAAGAIAPQVSGDIKVYSGPAIPANGITSLQLGALAFDIDLDRARFSQSTGNNGTPCCDWGPDGCNRYGGSASYYGTEAEWLDARRPFDPLNPLGGVDAYQLAEEIDGPRGISVRVDGCSNAWRWWNYCADGGQTGTPGACEWTQDTFFIGFQAGDPTGGPKDMVNGWMKVELNPVGDDLLITRWAYEDDGGPIDAGEGYCEADTNDISFEYIASAQIEAVGFFNFSESDGYTDYSSLGAIELAAGGTYTLKVGNGDPVWENDALGTYVDWNGDHEFTGPGEFLGSSPGVGPYFVQIEVPEDHPGGHVRLRLRLQDVDQDPMSPCGTALYGEVEDYLLDIVAKVPCVGDLDDDGEVTAADLGLLIGAWGACGDPADCPGDLDGDGEVSAADLGLQIGAWGACP
ncbi:MAG: hypothetical protein GY895_08840 [Phycisphaera sp.]|nr:hypothetical protein [Phycisphaera sp.]